MPRTVYIETSIPSYYHTGRKGHQAQAWKAATREWWATAGPTYRLVTSPITIAELEESTVTTLRAQRLALLQDLPRLTITERAIEAAAVYVREKAMPRDLSGDALHLAVAAVHGCDFILSLNFKHLVNENKRPHVEAVTRRLSLHVPRIVSPFQLGPDQ